MESIQVSHRQDWRRRGWLALVGAAHILALLCWRVPEKTQAPLATFHEPITYILLQRLPSRRPVAVRPALEQGARPLAAREAPPLPAEPVPQQAISQPAPPFDPFAPPARQEDDLKQRLLKSAAAVDKQMRKEAWNPHDKFVAHDHTALAEKIAGAYVGRDAGVTYEEVTLADGRHMTRIHGPGGTYCAYMESNAMTGGRDPFRDGVKTKVGTCPR